MQPKSTTRMKPGPVPTAPRDRIHRFVLTGEGCWGWAGATANGYGVIGDGVRKGRAVYAHRVALEVAMGAPVTPGFLVLHTCDTRSCTRNDDPGIYVIRGIARPRFGHLWLGTQLDNVADMIEKGRARNGDMRGEHNGRAVLTAYDVAAIRLALQNGTTGADLGRAYGVSKEAIYAIGKRRVWGHVP